MSRVAVRDLKPGQLIDLTWLPKDCPADLSGHPEIDREQAVVTDGGHGPRSWKTAGCVVLHTDQGSYELDPDFEFEVHGTWSGPA